MPLLSSPYRSPPYLAGGDIQSIVPALFRNVTGIQYSRKRIPTPDNDFIDLDWVKSDSSKIALVIHGLEASAQKPYMRGMCKTLLAAGFTVAAMNLRGCSGEVNRQVRSYHSGSTDDVSTVINYILQNANCGEMVLVGFSLGGNLVIKYLGERDIIPSKISKAVAISVPCDLEACSVHLDKRVPFIYRDRFLRTLKRKALLRTGRLPFLSTRRKITEIKSFREFDDVYTSQVYGFTDASDYYKKCSSKQFIAKVTIPVLILTAANDPFFTDDCIPFEECRSHPTVFLEVPDEGGHVGFCIDFYSGRYYSEKRTVEFLLA